MTTRTTTPTAPTPGLIASLTVRPWLDHTEGGEHFAPMLITHPAPRRDDDTPAAIEARMLGVADALGAVQPDRRLPDTGMRVAVHRGVVLVRLDGTSHTLTVRAPRWGRIITGLGAVVLAVGLDPLSAGAHGAEIDEYIERAGGAGRILFAGAQVALDARQLQRPAPLAAP
ncbi:hypothetical protein ACFVY9_03120 [Streptomyces sp. NPDC059544]|uniref:hypothetical protein n=1 Tax=Streptomyces sp. NPDC059544 TaxID=3346861 RepID=UPI0036840A46